MHAMKSPRFDFLRWSAALALAAFALLPDARGAGTNVVTNASPASAKTNAPATNSAPAELPVPPAVFDLAMTPTKDPFFPLSTRHPSPLVTNEVPTFSASNFKLGGLSGSSKVRLALINNRTLAEGEKAEITTPSGKIKIRCVEIKENSVVIRAESMPDTIEVFLRKAAQ